MQEVLNLQDYELTECTGGASVNTWFLAWQKRLENGIMNPLDTVVITLDAKNGAIFLLTRGNLIPDSDITMISKKQAIREAQPIIEKANSKVKDAQLTVVRPNFYWEEGEPYQIASFARIAWKVVLENKTEIAIDAETGEILGGREPRVTF